MSSEAVIVYDFFTVVVNVCRLRRCSGLMVSAMDSGSNSPGSRPEQGTVLCSHQGVTGVLDISLGGEVRPGPSNPDPVYDKTCPIFDTLFKTFDKTRYRD